MQNIKRIIKPINGVNQLRLKTSAFTPSDVPTKSIDVTPSKSLTWDTIIDTLGNQSLNSETRQTMQSRGPIHIVNIKSHRNNTILSLTDEVGNVLIKTSTGIAGYKKANRHSPEAAFAAAQLFIDHTRLKQVPIGTTIGADDGIAGNSGSVWIKFKGFGPGRDQTFRALRSANWNITQVEDVTPIKHGGCRPPKKKRR
jgi:ribosomal protein S11